MTQGHLARALASGYQLDDLIPLIPINAPLKPETRDKDGMISPALDPATVAMGKQPGTYINTTGAEYWVRRKAWNSTNISELDVAVHDGAGANLGLKCGTRIVALDVDIDDPVLMKTFRPIMEYFLEGPIRVGKAPKCLWLFRVHGEPIKRRQIALTGGHLIEVLGLTSTGTPSNCVVLGMHPSGLPYFWNGDGSLPHIDSLPVVDQAIMDRIVNASITTAKMCGLNVAQSESRDGGNAETSKLGLTVTPDLAAEVMDLLPNNDLPWDGWKTAGIALWNAVGPEDGWPIWEAWSRKATNKFDPGITEQVWFRRGGMWPNNQTSGFGSLVYRVRQAGQGDALESILAKRRQAKLWQQALAAGMPEHPIIPAYIERESRQVTDPAYGLMMRELRKVEPDGFQFVDLDVVTRIWDRSYHTADGKFRFLNAIGDPPVSMPAERFAAALPMHFGSLINWEAAIGLKRAQLEGQDGDLDAMAQDWAKSLAGALRGRLMLVIESSRQRTQIEANVNIFADEAVIEVGPETVRYELAHRPFPQGVVDDALVSDYLVHFPRLEDLLDLLVAARFARDRRKAFLWLRAVSNWGKGFLIQILTDLGLAVDMKEAALAKIMDGQPAPLSENDFLRAWIVIFDEFKSLKGDLKSINNRIPLSPKNRMRVTVDVYLKLFTSAEEVAALTGRGYGGVEPQFAMRFNHWHFTSGDIDERPVFQADPVAYMDSVRSYVAHGLNARVSEYRALGEADAARRAAAYLKAFHDANTIANEYEMIGSGISDIGATIVDMCRKFCTVRIVKGVKSERDRFDEMSQSGVPHEMTKLMDQHVKLVFVKGEPVVAVRKASAFVAEAIRIIAGRASQSLGHKIAEIMEQIEDRSFTPNYTGRGAPPITCERADVLPAFTTGGKHRFLAFRLYDQWADMPDDD
jgi:hypothetical protein